jgi:hypothetical protein
VIVFARAPRSFQRHRLRRGSVAVRLEDAERALLASLLDDVAALLEPDDAAEHPGAGDRAEDLDPWQQFEASMRVDPPSDPAVARLLPDGHRDDAEAAQSYRRLTEPGLRQAKRSALQRAASALRRSSPVVLTTEEALALLKGLTDVRLVLAERIGLRTDEDATHLHLHLAELAGRAGAGAEGRQLSEAEQRWAHLASIYEALTWWQEELVAAVG